MSSPIKMRYLRYFWFAILIIVFVWLIWPHLLGAIKQFPDLWKNANHPLILVLVFLQAVIFLSDVFLSKILFNIIHQPINLKNIMKVAALGSIGGEFLPVIGGAGISYVFYKKLKIPAEKILFLVTTWSALVVINYVFFFFISIFFVSKSIFSFLSVGQLLALLLVLAFLFLTLFLLLKNKAKILAGLLKKVFKKTNKAPEQIDIFFNNLSKNFAIFFSNKKKALLALLFSTSYYLATVALLYCSFLVFGYRPNFMVIIFGYVLAMILSLMTFAPEVPGVMDSSLAATFLLLGLPAQQSIFAVLLFRIFTFWLFIPLGIFLFYKKSKNRV